MRLSRSSILILLALWVAAMVLSGLALMADPTGDGFTRGLNRIMGFLSWQAAGMILALGLWIGVRPLPRGELLRWLGRAPGWWAMGVAALVVLWIAVGVIGSQIGQSRALDTEQQQRQPVTAPAHEY